MKKEEWAALILAFLLIIGPLFAGCGWPLIYSHWYQKSGQSPDPSEILGWLTLGVLAFQAFVYRQQRDLMNRQADIMARQTAISEQAMTIGLRPFLEVIDPDFVNQVSGSRAASHAFFDCKIIVHGQSPARVRAIYESLVLTNQFPAVPRTPIGWNQGQTTLKPGDYLTFISNLPGDQEIARTKIHAARTAGKQYFAVGRVIYDDIFGSQHEFGFCYLGTLGGGPGVMHGGHAYNYDRQIPPNKRI